MEKWYLSSARRVGTQHVMASRPCEDAVLTMEDNGVSVIALSDGCSSSPISEKGSQYTVSIICTYLTKHFDELYNSEDKEIKRKILQCMIKTASALVASYPKKVEEWKIKRKQDYEALLDLTKDLPSKQDIFNLHLCNATILFVAVKGDLAIVGRLGDGVIGQIENKGLKVLSEELKDNQISYTNYPSSLLAYVEQGNEDAWDVFDIQKLNVSNSTMFFLTSDGPYDAMVKNGHKGNTIFSILKDESIKELLISRNLNSFLKDFVLPTCETSDDMSIALMRKETVIFDSAFVRQLDTVQKDFYNDQDIKYKSSFKDVYIPPKVVKNIDLVNEIPANHEFINVLTPEEQARVDRYMDKPEDRKKVLIDVISRIRNKLKTTPLMTIDDVLLMIDYISYEDVIEVMVYSYKLHLLNVELKSKVFNK